MHSRNVTRSGTLNQWSYEAMGLCILTASLRKPNGRRHSRRTATGLAVGQRYQRELSCSSPPCLQSVHEPRSARHILTEIAARSGSNLSYRWYDSVRWHCRLVSRLSPAATIFFADLSDVICVTVTSEYGRLIGQKQTDSRGRLHQPYLNHHFAKYHLSQK